MTTELHASKNGKASDPSKVPDPYDPANNLYNSILALFAAQEQRHSFQTKWTVRAGLVLIVGLLITLAIVAHKPAQTYGVILDSRTHRVVMAQLIPLQDSAAQRELAVQSILPSIITYGWTYNDADSYNLGLSKQVDPYVLQGSLADTGFRKFTADLLAAAAATPGMKTKVDVDPQIQNMGSDVYGVGWVVRTLDQNGTLTDAKHYNANATVAWYPYSAENLPGLYLTDFRVTAESALPTR